VTKYEEKILKIIYTSNSHMTSEEIFLKLKKEEPKVVLASVYNNLNKLVTAKQITKISIPGHVDYYDKNTKHDHLVCSMCGCILDFSFSDLTKKIEKELGQQIEGYDLKVSYVCPKCAKKRRTV